jgi:type I restriction enzyme M protein
MSDSQQIVNKAWNFAHVLCDGGLSYMAHTEQITFLLFLTETSGLLRASRQRAEILLIKQLRPILNFQRAA